MTDPWRAPLAEWVQTHVGIIPIATVVGFGCPRRDAYRLAESDEFDIVMPGILRSTHYPLGPPQLMMAACLRNERAVIGRLTAAREWKFRSLPPDDEEVLVLLPHGRSASLPGVVIERSNRLDEVDIVRRADGTRLTSPPRTLFDCSPLLGVKRSGSVLEQLINDGRGEFVTHARTFARLGSPNRPGTRPMRSVLESRPPLRAAMQSELEVTLLRALQEAGVPAPAVQLWVTLPTNERIRLDFAWPDQRVALEVDHPFWHAGAAESHRDKRRDRLLATMGWVTIRVTDLDINHGLRASVNDVKLILATR